MFTPLIAALCLIGQTPEPSYLFQTKLGPERALALQREVYRPQPGDLLLYDDHSTTSAKLYRVCGTGGPFHAGMVFKKQDHTLAALEAGPNGVMKVVAFDLEPRLRGFDGTILIRRPRVPLSAEQSAKLTTFANAQLGKPYAIGRLALQTIPVRLRNAQYARTFGKTTLDRDRWFCSELVIACGAAAGIWELDAYPASTMYPRDLCYDEHFDLSPSHETPALWYPRAELERVREGVRVGK